MIDNQFVMYCNSDKWFDSYDKAFYNAKHFGSEKVVWYVFTPTGAKYKRVGELERAYKNYFKCDYYNTKDNTFYTQLNLKGLLQ